MIVYFPLSVTRRIRLEESRKMDKYVKKNVEYENESCAVIVRVLGTIPKEPSKKDRRIGDPRKKSKPDNTVGNSCNTEDSAGVCRRLFVTLSTVYISNENTMKIMKNCTW